MTEDATPARAALTALWTAAGLPTDALGAIDLTGADPVLPSSFRVGSAVQASLGAAALAAQTLGRLRGIGNQRVALDMTHAALDSVGWFSIDGVAPDKWDNLSGLYACGADSAPGFVRIHANFAHHRDIALTLLGCPTGAGTERAAVEQALRRWRAVDFETAVTEAGGVAAALRTFAQWDAHPQGLALADVPPVRIARIGDAPPLAPPLASLPGAGPLSGLRVLDLTRILAGPVAGRTLAAYGADVMLVNSPHLPNIESIADTSRGKLSTHIDLDSDAGSATLDGLLREAHVFLQGYRPGALAAHGFGPERTSQIRPGIVHVSLSAYGDSGPWAGKRGFDSLVQTATGFNHAEAEAAGSATPKAMPIQVLDYSAGYLLAFGAQAALHRQMHEGGSWHVQVSLAGVGHWLRSLGRVDSPARGFGVPWPPFEPHVETCDSGYGRLSALRHAAQFEATPARWARPSMPPGSHPPVWPG